MVHDVDENTDGLELIIFRFFAGLFHTLRSDTGGGWTIQWETVERSGWARPIGAGRTGVERVLTQ